MKKNLDHCDLTRYLFANKLSVKTPCKNPLLVLYQTRVGRWAKMVQLKLRGCQFTPQLALFWSSGCNVTARLPVTLK